MAYRWETPADLDEQVGGGFWHLGPEGSDLTNVSRDAPQEVPGRQERCPARGCSPVARRRTSWLARLAASDLREPRRAADGVGEVGTALMTQNRHGSRDRGRFCVLEESVRRSPPGLPGHRPAPLAWSRQPKTFSNGRCSVTEINTHCRAPPLDPCGGTPGSRCTEQLSCVARVPESEMLDRLSDIRWPRLRRVSQVPDKLTLRKRVHASQPLDLRQSARHFPAGDGVATRPHPPGELVLNPLGSASVLQIIVTSRLIPHRLRLSRADQP